MATLLLSDGTIFRGEPFGATVDSDGEVVFTTNMAGYPESLTDPSFRGQILVFTYPLIGNYGVPQNETGARGFSQFLESEQVHVRGVIVAQESRYFSHHLADRSLHDWLVTEKIPGISGIDTRALTKKLREHGVLLGRILQDDAQAARLAGKPVDIHDPNTDDLVGEVSVTEPVIYEPEGANKDTLTVLAYDCGMKRNIIRSFLARGVRVIRVPWNFDIDKSPRAFDGLFVSNGPGDPKACVPTIAAMKTAVSRGIPTFGICLGNQLLALAIGGDTYKLKYGHRGANQPCVEIRDDAQEGEGQRCIITSQNHGFAVNEKLPDGWHVWFRNANDGTVEGIRHESGTFFSVQFHPEAAPGPEDANYLFDDYVALLQKTKARV
jgi:carbamoyl-phosphate synthase small subunit